VFTSGANGVPCAEGPLRVQVGEEAKKLFEEAQQMLREFIAEKHVTLNAIIGLYPANTVGDDMEVYEDESRTTVRCKFHGLRQQSEKDEKNDPCAPTASPRRSLALRMLARTDVDDRGQRLR